MYRDLWSKIGKSQDPKAVSAGLSIVTGVLNLALAMVLW